MDLPPGFDSLRPLQMDALTQIRDAYRQGHELICLDAPTGVGKSIIGEMTRRLGLAGSRRALYVVHSKTLQDQLLKDFSSFAKVLKGRNNFPTLNHPERFGKGVWDHRLSCADCDKSRDTPDDDPTCSYCEPVYECPYEVAKNETLEAPLGIVNNAYALSEWQYVGKFRGYPLVIFDEGDVLEETLVGQVEVLVSKRIQNLLELPPPKKKTVEDTWLDWMEWAPAHIDQRLKGLPMVTPGDLRVRQTVQRLKESIEDAYAAMTKGTADFVYDYSQGLIRFSAVSVRQYGWPRIWNHMKKSLMMSATIISSEELTQSLGWDLNRTSHAFIQLDSPFPVANRPIYFIPACSMVRSAKEAGSWEDMARAVNVLLEMRPDVRVLIHTHSYELTAFLTPRIRARFPSRPVVAYLSASDRDEAIATYESTPASVLLASSLDRGVDFKDDLCRLAIICKTPLADLSDKRVSKRLYSYNGQLWYATNTARSVVQASGRAVRHETDFAETIILDSHFAKFFTRWGTTLFPKWWRGALHWQSDLRREVEGRLAQVVSVVR